MRTVVRVGASTLTADRADSISPDELFFDEQNPRLQGEVEGQSQDDILKKLWDEFAVDEVALSITANGFFQYEPMFAAKERGRLVVIEGNRRLAAVKLLLDPKLQRAVGATDLDPVTPAVRRTLLQLPVIVCDRAEIWGFIGFKHVNGAQPWDAIAKADYIAWVHNTLNIPLPAIARQIGDQHSTVIRLYNALMALNQVEDAGVWHRDDRWNKRFFFSHLYIGLTDDGIKQFLGITASKNQAMRRPVSTKNIRKLGELCTWLFGSKSREARPVIHSQNPDLRNLAEVLSTPNGVAAMRRGLPLQVSLEISKGDDRILRELLVQAKQALVDARGRVLTGYDGEADLRKQADEIYVLAEGIVDDMARFAKARGRASSRR
jgi:hypothetical protein